MAQAFNISTEKLDEFVNNYTNWSIRQLHKRTLSTDDNDKYKHLDKNLTLIEKNQYDNMKR